MTDDKRNETSADTDANGGNTEQARDSAGGQNSTRETEPAEPGETARTAENEVRPDKTEKVEAVQTIYTLAVYTECGGPDTEDHPRQDGCGAPHTFFQPKAIAAALRGDGINTICEGCGKMMVMLPAMPQRPQVMPANAIPKDLVQKIMQKGNGKMAPNLIGPNGRVVKS